MPPYTFSNRGFPAGIAVGSIVTGLTGVCVAFLLAAQPSAAPTALQVETGAGINDAVLAIDRDECDRLVLAEAANAACGAAMAPEAAVAPEVDLSIHEGRVSRPDLCLRIALTAEASFECGNLRIEHVLPATRTMNVERVPVLTYNSQHARPYVLVPIHVRLPAGGTVPTKVTATLTAGAVVATGTWTGTGWNAAGVTRRVTVGFTPTVGSGVHAFSLEVTNWYGTTPYSTVVSGNYVVVDRATSPFGAGWWLAGLEQLITSAAPTKLTLIDGGGGVREYTSAGTGKWRALNVDRPDSIITSGTNYVRNLHGGGRVVFNSAGSHIETANSRDHKTVFAYSSGRLATITLPAVSSPPSYSFTYTSNYLTSVTAPGSRTTTIGRSGAVVTSIQDHGGAPAVTFASANNRITTRTDRRGKVASFTYSGSTWRLSQTKIDPSSLNITTDVTAAEGRGYGSGATAVASSSVDDAHTLLNGPRSDVSDFTRFWIDRFGAPAKIRDANGSETVLTRANATFPALVTQIAYPGFTESADYDSRGRITTSTQVNPYGTGVNAVTTYAWANSSCPDNVTQITMPGAAIGFSYETTYCNLTWQQTGGSARRVNFAYHPTTRLLTEILEPGTAQPQRFTYDGTLANLRTTKSPIGFLTLTLRDAIGRPTTLYTPTDSSTALTEAGLISSGVTRTLQYDARDRILVDSMRGPARPTCPGCTYTHGVETVKIQHSYDAESNPLSNTRTGNTIAGPYAVSWTYDNAGRVLQDARPGLTLVHTYDPAGNVTLLQRGPYSINMQYDVLNRLIRRIVPQRSFSQQTCQNHPVSGTCGYTFPLFPNSGTGLLSATDTQTFGYDARSNMTSAWNRDARINRTYYNNGLLRTDTVRLRSYASTGGGPGGPGDPQFAPMSLSGGGTVFTLHVYGLRYSYDLGGRRTAVRYPTNVMGASDSIRSTYTSVYPGQLHQVTDPLGTVYTHTYTNRGELAGRTFAGGGNETFTYDGDGRLRQRQLVTSPLGTFVNHTFRYDGRDRTIALSGSGLTISAQNWYSGLGSLIASDVVKTTGSLSYLEEFKLDGAANVIERRRHGPNHLPQQHSIMADQLTAINTVRPPVPSGGLIANDTYNHFQGSTGEVLASGTVTESVQGGVWQETARMASQNYFSTDGKLIVHQRYEDETGTGQRWGVWEEYRYDALGRRVLTRTQRPNTICNVANCYSSITRFIWDGDQLALELRAPGAPTDNLESTSGSMPRFGTVAYTHGGGIDRPLGLMRGSTVASTFLVVPHTDWRGLFDRGTNSSGQLFDNRPGEPPIDWPGRDRLSYHDESRNTQPLGSWYGSLIQDMKDESGLAYRRNRYYDPNTGRFVQQDPIGLAGGINLYGFAGGDPVNFSDPFGLCAIKGAAASVAMGRGIAAATGSEYGAGSLALDVVGGALCAGVVVRGVQLLRGGRQAATAATATRAAGAGDEAFHHTFRRRLASIQTDGLRPGSYATPRGGLSPLQAHIDLALPGGLRDAVVRIDLAGLRAAGFEIPEVTRVGRSFGMPGGGFEMRFPYAVPSEFIRVVTP